MKKLTLISTLFLSFLLIILTLPLTAQSNVIKGKLYGVGQGGNTGNWNGTTFTAENLPWQIKSIAVNPTNGESWVIGWGGNVGINTWTGGKVEDRGFLGNWNLNSIAFTKNGKMWCVGTGGNVGIWDGVKIIEKENLGGWKISSIAFDKTGQMWCVGTGGNVGKWNGSNWESDSRIDQWKLNFLAFDKTGQMWCVGTGGNVGKWNGINWEDQGKLGGWNLSSLLFLESDPVISPAKGSWIDVPTNKISGIQLMRGGSSIKLTLGSSMQTSLLTASEKSKNSSSSLTQSMSVSSEGKVPGMGKVTASYGLSSTQSESITNSVKKQTEKTLKETKTWELNKVCPETAPGYVRFAISENIVRIRENPMSIKVGEEVFYAQEYIDYSNVNFSKPYKVNSTDLQDKWQEYKANYSRLMSEQQYTDYVKN